MTDQDILLVAVLASSAVIITLADLLFSLWCHCRRARRARSSGDGAGFVSPGDAAAAARREAIRRRLAAIQSSGDER